MQAPLQQFFLLPHCQSSEQLLRVSLQKPSRKPFTWPQNRCSRCSRDKMTNYQFICYHSTAHQFYIGDGNRNKKANYSCICYYSTAHHCHIGSRTNRNKNTYYWFIRYLTALFSRFTLVVEQTEITTSSVKQDSMREQSQLSLKKKKKRDNRKDRIPLWTTVDKFMSDGCS